MSRQSIVQVQQPKMAKSASKHSGLLLRKCACGQHTIAGGECEECRQKREGMLQRTAESTASVNGIPSVVHEVLSSPGQPLDAETRTFMEPRFGHDFSQVRVHTDARAAESARAVNALAYTVGRDVVFGEGEYKPGTSEGRRLLAHELTHVVQQAQDVGGNPLQIGSPETPHEREADRIAHIVNSEHAEINTPLGASIQKSSGTTSLQRLGANPGCTAAEATTIHQAIFNARGWLNKAIAQLETLPLSPKVIASLRRNFGPTYGVAENVPLIVGRMHVAYHDISTNPYSCAGAADAGCAAIAGGGGYSIPGSHVSTICSAVTFAPGTSWIYQAGVVLHESSHAAFSGFTMARDRYSGWHGASVATPGYPGPAVDPLLNADTYTTLVMDLS